MRVRSLNDWSGLPVWTEEDEEQAWKKVEDTLWAAIVRAYCQQGWLHGLGRLRRRRICESVTDLVGQDEAAVSALLPLKPG